MKFEKAQFGHPDASNVLSDVSTHFAGRETGGEFGTLPTSGLNRESVVDFNESEKPLYVTQVIPAGSVVTDVKGFGLTGTVSAATVGAVDISGADGTAANEVVIATAGALTVTGPTAGTVVVKYSKVHEGS